MRTMLTLNLMLALLIAGCAGPAPTPEVESSTPTARPATGNETLEGSPPAVEFVLIGNQTTRAATVTYLVKTDRPTTITIEFNATVLDSLVVNGSQEWSIDLPYGQRVLTATAQTPGFSAADQKTLLRLAPTTLTIDYCTFHPDRPGQRTVEDHEYWIDVDSRPSTPLYEQAGGQHADAFTAHDQLYTFEQETSTPVVVNYSESFSGFFVEYIDGAGNPASSDAPPYWLFEVNGESAPMGMSLQPIAPGDAVRWILSTLGPPCE